MTIGIGFLDAIADGIIGIFGLVAKRVRNFVQAVLHVIGILSRLATWVGRRDAVVVGIVGILGDQVQTSRIADFPDETIAVVVLVLGGLIGGWRQRDLFLNLNAIALTIISVGGDIT